jgi:2-polyprenyl-6-methoxyphenol hydroxylase-like FAD-dependent oxidoreductase
VNAEHPIEEARAVGVQARTLELLAKHAVDAVLRTPHGDERAGWLVGCDGAHSTVRHLLVPHRVVTEARRPVTRAAVPAEREIALSMTARMPCVVARQGAADQHRSRRRIAKNPVVERSRPPPEVLCVEIR